MKDQDLIVEVKGIVRENNNIQKKLIHSKLQGIVYKLLHKELCI